VDNLYDGWVGQGIRRYPWFRRAWDYYEYPAASFHSAAGEVTALALRMLRERARPPFAAFVHLWDPHRPYTEAPEEFYRFYEGGDPCDPRLDVMSPTVRAGVREMFGAPVTDPAYVRAAYDAEVACADEAVGALLEALEEEGLSRDTVVVVTSDHGEIVGRPRLAAGQLYDYGHIGLSEDCLRVPLIMAGPGIERGRRAAGQFQLPDVLPTLLELFDLQQRIELDGVSLAPELRGQAMSGRDRMLFGENTYQKQRALTEWPWKYTRFEAPTDGMPRRGLYHLERDPAEQVNLVDWLRSEADRLDTIMEDAVDGLTGDKPDPLRRQEISRSPALSPDAIRY
jgi:choline-sulfatase